MLAGLVLTQVSPIYTVWFYCDNKNSHNIILFHLKVAPAKEAKFYTKSIHLMQICSKLANGKRRPGGHFMRF